MSDTFTALDFETAQGYRWSICQVGLVRVINGDIVAKLDILVKPPSNYYWRNFTEIHGISANGTMNAPTFDEIWPIIRQFIEGQHVVAHNSRFDFACLNSTLKFYNIDPPVFSGECTYSLFGRSLKSLCLEYGIPLDHHNALSDAMACAYLFLNYNKILTLDDSPGYPK